MPAFGRELKSGRRASGHPLALLYFAGMISQQVSDGLSREVEVNHMQKTATRCVRRLRCARQRATWDRRRWERGASLVEYALLIALIAVVCVAVVAVFGGETSNSFDSSGRSLANI